MWVRGTPEASEEDWANAVVTYDLVWVISTRITATLEMAQEIYTSLYQQIEKNVSLAVAKDIHAQYEESIQRANTKDLLVQPHISRDLISNTSFKTNFSNDISR